MGSTILYLLAAAAVFVVVGLVAANRKQARATHADARPEPDLDLAYRPPPPPHASELKALLEKPRDPALARLSSRELVMEVLKECYDPEIPLNIVDLGLVYDVDVGKDETRVTMSLTAPGCPSSETIKLDICGKLEEAGFPAPKVEIVWEPQWTAHRISPEGRKKLGIDSAEAAAKLIPTHPDPEPGGKPAAG